LDFCKDVIARISALVPPNSTNDTPTGCYQFAGTLALLAAGRAYSTGSDRAERTNALLNLLPQGQLIGVQFVGTMSGLDLRDLPISIVTLIPSPLQIVDFQAKRHSRIAALTT